MSLFWKKRGSYELVASPSFLEEERYSWSSSLDVIYDLSDEKPAQEEENVWCQHPACVDRRRATKVCHHPDCQELNGKSPLLLCPTCDSRCHSDAPNSMHIDRHPRFDLQPQGSVLARNVSTRSCPPRTSPPPEEDDEEGSNEPRERKTAVKPKKPRRRHTDDPRKECFTLKFDLNVDIETEIVPALKKRSLQEVLGPVFERKGIELSRVDLFLDQSNTPLQLSFEAYRFGGHYLKVKARPGDELKVEQCVKDLRSLSLPNMKQVVGQSPYILSPTERSEHGSLGRRDSTADLLGQIRRRKNMTEFLGDANIPSPDSLSQLGPAFPALAPGPETWKNKAAIRISGIFGAGTSYIKEVDRVEQLQNKLHMYTHYGLPKVSLQVAIHNEEEETSFNLEESWQQLLDEPEMLTKRQFQQQEAIWELLQTEAAYIKKLRVITDLFLCGLLNLHASGILNEVEPARLFSNVQDLVRLHTELWVQVMQPALNNARHGRKLLNPTDLQEGFETFGSRFQPYVQYCMEEEGCMEYMRSQLRDNELYKIFITWVEAKKECNRLKLADMLVKPHQRLTKYPLLLKTILKKTDDPSVRDALNNMVMCVEGFINKIDAKMQHREEQQKLAAISARVESYEATEGGSEEVERILREYNHFNLMAPMIDTSPEESRQLHLEGALRMKEGKDSRMDVHCFLFTDLLLITKPVKRLEKVKVIRQPLLMHNVVCKELKDPGAFVLIYLNEFRTAVAAYCFQANSATQGRNWVDGICKAQKQLQRLRSEEARRRQALRRQQHLEEDEETEEEEGSCNSTASSPSPPHRELDHNSSSDGSTDTLSVGEENEAPSSSSPGDMEPGSTGSAAPDTDSQLGTKTEAGEEEEVDPQRRSLSLDSAYGTLSPESTPELGVTVTRSEGSEMGGAHEEDKVEREEEEDEEEEDSEGDQTSFGSQVSVSRGLKRRPPVSVTRVQTLQTLAGKSRSEDNLLQCFHGNRRPRALCRASPEPLTNQQSGESINKVLSDGLHHSKSLNELGSNISVEMDEKTPPGTPGRLTRSLPSALLSDTLRRAKAVRRSLRAFSADSRAADQENQEAQDVSSEDERGRRRSSQQHKKLTLAQLYRIRTTLVLNSTLTAS
ncbi:pleckstrin homology domain-containing family G member 5-like isoform X3 [Denticeps clupeoides]|nr:pleckstrin homology domain-containing family G member 5-like isoform X3 [Denticeps clupeoides]